MSEIRIGMDDQDLDFDNDNVPNRYDTGIPAQVERDARSRENIKENTYWQSDWGAPGKQHKTNRKYND